MGKFVNPKKIKGQDKLNRIKDLMGKMNTLNESTSHSELELVKKGPNGVVYGIVRENRNYFIKTSTKTNGELKSNDFDYEETTFTIDETRLLISEKIKKSFDPKRIFNPGKMYRGI